MHTLEEYEDLWWEDNEAHRKVLAEYGHIVVAEQDSKADYEEHKAIAYKAARVTGKTQEDAKATARTDARVKLSARAAGKNEALRKYAEARMRYYAGRAMGARGWGKTREEEMKLQ
jgi:hypothetical protein